MAVVKAKRTRGIAYPYIHPAGIIKYVPTKNPYIMAAKDFARRHSLDKVMPTGAVLVKQNQIVGYGANGSDYHKKYGCERVRLGIPTGQGYELCEGCSPANHSEPRVVAAAQAKGVDTEGAVIYLWGHWWCCEACWKTMIKAGIKTVYLLENSEILFNKTAIDNIVGHQFD